MGTQYNRNRKKEDEDKDLMIFGYSCKLYNTDEKARFISEERHLQQWNGDSSLRIDRYDCRLLLMTIDERPAESDELECPTEQMEEEMCEEERYKDMYRDIQTQAQIEADKTRKKTEIAYNYGTTNGTNPNDNDSDSEDEPFVPPVGIKLPVGLATPDNLKQSHIIERTAVFVVEKGPQMEIIIKAKQRNNTEQFGFLDFDNVLYPYYKYISKIIREKKYTPIFKTKEEKKAEQQKQKERKPINALTALAAEHSGSDDSDSDCELHPSLFAVQKRDPSPDILDRTKNAVGPRQKPLDEPPASPFNITQSNDMYASLFKSLTGYTEPPKPEPKSGIIEPPRPASVPIKKEEPVEKDPDVDIEWQQWWMKFYGMPPPAKAPNPMIPPPPDMEPVVCRYAEFVARHGSQAEFGLVARPDLKLHFMDPTSPFFSYYQHKVRYAQWEMTQTEHLATGEESSSPHSPATMNRKQRRRLQDAQKVGPAPPPGVIDPFLLKSSIQTTEKEMQKTHSCPANLGTPEKKEVKPYDPLGAPISFSLAKEDSKVLANNFDDDEEASVSLIPSTSESNQTMTKPLPEPSTSGKNQQLDRKEKARIFMEKLLNEKRNKKLKDAEETKIRDLENKKAELEQKLAEDEVGKTLKEPEKKKPALENAGKTLNMIDQIISSRIENLLQASGIAPKEKSEESKKRSPSKERKSSREKKSKKHKRKRSRSRSRSREHGRRRQDRKRRSRSRSADFRRHRY